MAENPRPARAQDQLSILYSFPLRIGEPGIGWTAWNQVTELVAAGHRVHLVAGSIGRPIGGLASVTTSLSVGRMRVPHRLIGRERAFAWHDRVAARSAAVLSLDAVHGWPLGSRRTFDQARLRGVPSLREVPNTHTHHAYTVVAAEDASLGLIAPTGSSHAFNARRLAEENAEWSSATALLVPSDAVANTFLACGFAPERLLRHRYGYRPSVAPRGAARPTADPFTAVFLGRGEPRKGLHYALQAWVGSTASQRGRFLIFGEMRDDYRRVLAPLLAHPSVEERGFTRDPDLVLAWADVLLLPSIEEGSALVSYEAQAVGCVPLVSVAVGAVLDDGVQGLVHEVGDVDTLTRQLDLVSGDAGVLSTLRAAAIAAAPRLTWSAATDALVAAYRQAAVLERGSSVLSA